MSTATSLIGRLRTALSGDTLLGLSQDEARGKISTYQTPLLLKLWRSAVENGNARAPLADEAHAAYHARLAEEAAAALDDGRRHETVLGTEAWAGSPECKAMTKRLAALEDGDLAGGHSGLVALELVRRYATETPRELAELKTRIAKATGAVWSAAKVFHDAQKAYCALRSEEAEAEVFSADRSRAEAERAQAALKLEAFEQFAVRA